MIDIATLGMFRSQRCGGEYIGGAIIPIETEDHPKRLSIRVKAVSSKNKKTAPLKIILKCSDNNSGVT